MFRFALIALLFRPSACLAQIASPLLTPGTTPLYYRITFAGTKDNGLDGRTFFLRQEGPSMWRSEFRAPPVNPRCRDVRCLARPVGATANSRSVSVESRTRDTL
jgi:hypothetical protein